MFRFYHGGINQKLLTLLSCVALMFAPIYTHATPSDYDYWKTLSLEENVDSTGRVTSARLNGIKRTVVNGSAREVQAVLDYSPRSGAAGRVMFNRLAAQAAAGAGVVIIGAAALDALLRGIGWIMEDGVYVKIRNSDDSGVPGPSDPKQYCGVTTPGQAEQCYGNGSSFCKAFNTGHGNGWWGGTVFKDDGCWGVNSNTLMTGIIIKTNPLYDPSAPPTNQPTKTPLTPEELDRIMHGNYEGDPSSNIQPKNDGDWTSIVETFEDDPNAGEGTRDDGKADNDVSKDVQRSLENAPNRTVTNTGTQSSSTSQSTTNNADGTQQRTETNSNTTYPAFCVWAAGLCQWIDWTKEEYQPDEEEVTELEIEELPNTHTLDIHFNGGCPPDVDVPVHVGLINTELTISYRWPCKVAEYIKPVVIAFSSLTGVFIVAGIRNEDQI